MVVAVSNLVSIGQREIFFALSEAESVYGLGVNLVFLTADLSPYGIGTPSVILHWSNCI